MGASSRVGQELLSRASRSVLDCRGTCREAECPACLADWIGRGGRRGSRLRRCRGSQMLSVRQCGAVFQRGSARASTYRAHPELVHTVHILYAEMLVVSGAGDQLDALAEVLAEVLGDMRAAGHVG